VLFVIEYSSYSFLLKDGIKKMLTLYQN